MATLYSVVKTPVDPACRRCKLSTVKLAANSNSIMGKQISQKPEKAEVNRNGGLEDIKKGRSLFTCFNCAMMIYTAALAIIVAAVIVKASDLQILIEEKDLTISELRSEVESVKKQLYRSVADSEAQQQNSEKKIDELSSQVKEAVETLNKHTREFKS